MESKDEVMVWPDGSLYGEPAAPAATITPTSNGLVVGGAQLHHEPQYAGTVAGSPQDWAYGAGGGAGGHGGSPSRVVANMSDSQLLAAHKQFQEDLKNMELQDIKDFTVIVLQGEAMSIQAQRLVAKLGPNRNRVYVYMVGPHDERPPDVEVFPAFYDRRRGVIYQAAEALSQLRTLLPAHAQRDDRRGPQQISYIASDLANTKAERKWQWNVGDSDGKTRKFNIVAEDSAKGGKAPSQEEVDAQLQRRENFFKAKLSKDDALLPQWDT